MSKKNYEPKPLFLERMRELLGEDFENYINSLKGEPKRSIRCNTLKISSEKLKEKLENYGWKISQPFKENPEIMILESNLEPGELGRAMEHLLGYYYIQELSSMLPAIALNPKPGEWILDLCAAPGSKTTQIAAMTENNGTIIANEVSLGRIKILASNLERCGASNVIITKKEGYALCKKLFDLGYKFDKILVDAPCSGEGTVRTKPATFQMWNINTVKQLQNVQKSLLEAAIELLKENGEVVYSTCTHSPEENEEVLDYILRKYPNIKIQNIKLPIKTRQGILKWQDKEYLEDVKLSCRVYPQDNESEGFFISKLKKVSE